jgi:GMP synthase-like glutamine amidotransferase
MREAILLQHDGDTPPGLLDEWARERDASLTTFHMRRGRRLPDPSEFEFAIVLGSVAHADERAEPWVREEIEWLRRADERALPVLGICFGGQVLAAALGGSVRRAPRPQIGWISVDSDEPDLIGSGPWYSWHEDVIDLPADAVEIARDDFCVQAYTLGPHLGLQFHPEVTAELAAEWVAEPGVGEEFRLAGVDPDAFARETERMAPIARHGAIRLFDGFIQRAAAVRTAS